MISQNQPDAPPVIVAIGGSDPSGGAGIQADIKTITAFGGYAAAVITALTVQNTIGISDVLAIDPHFVGQQLEAVLTDLPVAAIKIGMLHSAEVVREVAAILESLAFGIPVILDPVVLSSSGTPLLDNTGIRALCQLLLPLSALITPNLPEAQLLTGVRIEGEDEFGRACDHLLAAGASAVLIKGGHLSGALVVDYLRMGDGTEQRYEATKLESRSTHGTGCTLASAIATLIGEGRTLSDAVYQAQRFVHQAILDAVPMGRGVGPLNHVCRHHR